MADRKRICSIPDCGKPHYGRGYCAMHLHRFKVHGDPHKRARLANGESSRWIDEVALNYEGEECLPWPFGRINQGYGILRINGRDEVASRVVCERAYGTPPTPKHQAAHSCGNGHHGCVNKRHLSWKTPSENAADKIVHGTTTRGERSALAKLNSGQVAEIRSLIGRVPQRQIAARFGIDQSTVSDIKRGKSWDWL